MMKIAIMTDTNSGITFEEAKRAGIYMLPMPVLIDDQCYLEGVDITNEQLYEAMRLEKKISTSQPSPGSIADLWNDVLKAGYDKIIHIPMTSGLSGSCQSARLLAGEFEGKVLVVDNQRISATQRESVFEAKRMEDAGNSAEQIRDYLEAAAFGASIYLTVTSLKYLQMGGRLSPSAAMLGTILNIKPVLSIQGEQIDVVARVRSMKICERKMIEAVKKDIDVRFANIPAGHLQVATAGTLQSREAVDDWLHTVQSEFPGMYVYYDPLPCSIACHVGPDCRGVGVVAVER